LWPLSRTHYPKQFLRLVDDFSLLQNTLRRLDGLVGLGEDHRRRRTKTTASWSPNSFLEIGQQADILLEPAARNTAPAVAAAALHAIRDQAVEQEPYPSSWCLPSDHVIADVAAFPGRGQGGRSARAAPAPWSPSASSPIAPETGYGYIRRGEVRSSWRLCPRPLSSRSPIAETARRLPRFRRLLLEQRHVPLPRRHLPRSPRPLSRRASASALPAAVAPANGCDLDFLRLDHA
jgi:mannose-1-phosphate guanylyltransferase